MMSSNAHNGIERLKGRDNYATWSFSVKTFLEHEELLECIEADIVKDAKKDSKAKTKIILLVDPSLYIHIEEATTANQVWENLKKAFEDSGLSRKVNLLRDLINTSLETSNGVEDYISKIMSAAHKLRNIKFHVDDEWLGTLMLAGLSDEYKPMIMGLESSGVKISADLIKTKLLQEVKDSSATSAFYTNSSKKLFRNSHQQQSKSKGPRCFNCNKYGHLGKNCWFKNKKDNHDNNKSNGFVAAFSALTSNDSAKWYLDSGAAMHMTMHREWLQDETVPPVRHVRIADDKMLHVESCGKVEICVPSINGSTSMIQVSNVLYVPDLKANLLSISKIIKSGCKVQFDEHGCQIFNKNGEKVAMASQINDTYILHTKTAHAMAATTDNNNTYLWHLRMGHLNFTDLNKITNCATGVKLSEEKESSVCISCIEGKQSRLPFPSDSQRASSRATSLLELIHTDVCGPMQQTSIGGARYFVTFIDDYSRKVFVYFIKSKSEVFEKFKEYKNRVENELNCKIKTLRSDNGKEYINQHFSNYLKNCGILHQTSNPYTPEQNGLSERMNRTLIERAKCMLFNAMLQMGYWAEAVGTAAYIVNRSPTRALSFITPEEMWTGTAPDLSHLRVFGCEAMVHIPKEQRRKLDAKSHKLIFVGYSACTKGYRFIDPQSRRVYMSRDVIFLEGTAKRNTVQSFASENNTVNEKSSSAPEKEKKNTLESEVKVQEVVENRTQLEDKSREKENILNEQNKVYLPLSQTETAPENNENESYNETTSSTHSELLYESTHEEDTNSDPNDETYVPSGSDVDTSPENKQRPSRRNEFYQPRSYICMNSESTMSYLDSDPLCHEEALNSDKKNEWLNAMNEEYQALLQNNTWNLVELPEGKKVIPCKWVFKTKRDENGNIQRYKARLVIKGFRQTKGVDYHEVYAPVVRYSSVRYLLGVAAKYNLRIHQMDTVTAFLQGDVEEEIFMCQPPNYEEGHMVCKLNKSLYGLKQASRQWNKKLNKALLQIGLTRSKVDPCIYYRIVNDKNILFITVYVDDLMYFFNDEETASVVKLKLKEKFLMKDMGEVKQCMGYKIKQCGDEIHVSQTIYIEKILERFVMSDCNAVSTPCDPSVNLKKAESEEEILRNIPYQEAIGCLLYLSQGTRPDITYIVNTLSKFNNQPTAQHWAALKRVFRYLKGTKDLQLVFKCDAGNIVGYCDADWASNTDDRRSCTGYIFLFQGAAISWSSKRQPTVALSSTEAEYMALSSAIQEAMWLKQLQEDFWPSLSNDSFDVYCDNQSALSIAGHDVYHARSKHIDVRYHFIREKIEAKQISLKYQCSEDMVADALTKGLQRLKHDRHLSTMGLRSGEGVEVNAANTE